MNVDLDITLRHYIAVQFLLSQAEHVRDAVAKDQGDAVKVARFAYLVADAMLIARVETEK